MIENVLYAYLPLYFPCSAPIQANGNFSGIIARAAYLPFLPISGSLSEMPCCTQESQQLKAPATFPILSSVNKPQGVLVALRIIPGPAYHSSHHRSQTLGSPLSLLSFPPKQKLFAVPGPTCLGLPFSLFSHGCCLLILQVSANFLERPPLNALFRSSLPAPASLFHTIHFPSQPLA